MNVKLGNRSLPTAELFGLLSALLVIVGSAGAWVRIWGVGFVGDEVEIIYVNGTIGDGRVTIALGILAAVLIIWRLLRQRSSTWSTIVQAATIVILIIAGLVGVFNWSELNKIPGLDHGSKFFQYGFQPGWGLILLTIAGLAGAGALVYQMWQEHYR